MCIQSISSAGKLYFINRFFYPDFSAASLMLTDLGVGLAGAYDITVVASRALYDDSLATLARWDNDQAIEVLRLSTTRRGRAACVAGGGNGAGRCVDDVQCCSIKPGRLAGV